MTGCRGRSGLHRAGRWATATRSNPRDSATENRPPQSSDSGKGETVVQETTSGPGDRAGLANPARSKVEQRTSEGCPPECAGGPHEAAGNGGPRWMVVERSAARTPGTEPGLQTSPSANSRGSVRGSSRLPGGVGRSQAGGDETRGNTSPSTPTRPGTSSTATAATGGGSSCSGFASPPVAAAGDRTPREGAVMQRTQHERRGRSASTLCSSPA